jgi:hypothetical protein
MDTLTDYLPELALPPVKDARAVMKDSFLRSDAYADTFGFLVAVLVGIERMPDSERRTRLFERVGAAICGLGNGDSELGTQFMRAAGYAAQKLYGEPMHDLNMAWSGIGFWRA